MKIELQKEARPVFRQMAKEAGLGERDLAEIACYNLIAIWLKEHGRQDLEYPASEDITQPDSASVPGLSNR